MGGHMRGMPVLLLTTTGRKTGLKRTVPLMYIHDGADYIITASNNGADHHPAWWLNLQKTPQAAIEIEGAKKSVMAKSENGKDRNKLWDKFVEEASYYGGYQSKTEREIPVVRLSLSE